jgi:DNA-directed RNA polymerase subunit L
MHGQSDTDEVDDMHFFVDAVNKSIHNAVLNHNKAFLNTFHNTMKEVFYGFPLDQVGPAYYNIPHPSTQGTNHASTSQQGVALAKDDDIKAIQNSSDQI